MNLYEYVRSSPVGAIDPMGLTLIVDPLPPGDFPSVPITTPLPQPSPNFYQMCPKAGYKVWNSPKNFVIDVWLMRAEFKSQVIYGLRWTGLSKKECKLKKRPAYYNDYTESARMPPFAVSRVRWATANHAFKSHSSIGIYGYQKSWITWGVRAEGTSVGRARKLYWVDEPCCRCAELFVHAVARAKFHRNLAPETYTAAAVAAAVVAWAPASAVAAEATIYQINPALTIALKKAAVFLVGWKAIEVTGDGTGGG